MHFVVISIFPEMLQDFTNYGIISKSIKNNIIKISTINPRRFAKNNYKRIDDKPFGGGPGMVMMYEPIKRSIIYAQGLAKESKVIYLSPQGIILKQQHVKNLSAEKNIILICGRYKGIDERIVHEYVDKEISIGDYVTSGGEVPAMVLIECITRMIPNAIKNQESVVNDSFYDSVLLDHPHYTRPAILKNNNNVPKILLSGAHKKIKDWRQKQKLKNTFKKRQDLINNKKISKEDKNLIEDLKKIHPYKIIKNKKNEK